MLLHCFVGGMTVQVSVEEDGIWGVGFLDARGGQLRQGGGDGIEGKDGAEVEGQEGFVRSVTPRSHDGSQGRGTRSENGDCTLRFDLGGADSKRLR